MPLPEAHQLTSAPWFRSSELEPPTLVATVAVAQYVTPNAGDATALSTGSRRKSKTTSSKSRAKSGAPIKRPRKGWGPYNSVLKERSVDFNLTLDVQHLQQQIQQLTTARDLLQSRVLQQRHSPTGSLMRVVHEFFRVFRAGLRVEQQPYASRRRRVITQSVQTDFLASVLDQDELNSALGRMGGVAFFVEMFRRYSLLLRFVCMKMDAFDIVVLDDGAVMVKTSGSFRFQVLRETVLGIFPHILGNEWLCARLIGAVVESPLTITFNFNANDLICGYEPDVDHIAGFSQLFQDPNDVLELLGRARMGVKATIAVSEDGALENVDVLDELEIDEESCDEHQDAGYDHEGFYSHERARGRTPDRPDTSFPSQNPTRNTPTTYMKSHVPPLKKRNVPGLAPTRSRTHSQSIVGRYMLAFANGWWPEVDTLTAGAAASIPSPQRDFLRECVSPHVIVGQQGAVGHHAIEHVWKSLCASFEFVGFRATSQPQVSDHGDVVSVHIQAAYDVAIDISTLQAVFPHALRHPELVQALLGMEVSCPSALRFDWHDRSRLITGLSERLDWDAALSPLLPSTRERAFVLERAQLTAEGYVAAR